MGCGRWALFTLSGNDRFFFLSDALHEGTGHYPCSGSLGCSDQHHNLLLGHTQVMGHHKSPGRHRKSCCPRARERPDGSSNPKPSHLLLDGLTALCGTGDDPRLLPCGKVQQSQQWDTLQGSGHPAPLVSLKWHQGFHSREKGKLWLLLRKEISFDEC